MTTFTFVTPDGSEHPITAATEREAMITANATLDLGRNFYAWGERSTRTNRIVAMTGVWD